MLLRAGESVIVDATWSNNAHRAFAQEVAAGNGAELAAIECRLDPQLAAERIRHRQAQDVDASDATPDLVALLTDARHAWPGAHQIDTDRAIDAVLADAIAVLEPGAR